VATAPAAHADLPPRIVWEDRYNPLGLTKVDTYYTTGSTFWATYAAAYPLPIGYSSCNYFGNIANSVARVSDFSSAGAQTRFGPGSTTTFCLAVMEGNDGSSTVETWSTVTLAFKDSAGNTIGSTYTMTNSSSNHNQMADIPVRFDSNPLNGTTDSDLAPGDYEMYVTVTTSSRCTTACTSQGGGNATYNGRGYVRVGAYLYGAHPKANDTTELTQEQASTGVNKNFSLVRDYKSDWNAPSARVATWASQGKAVVWSAKPPAWNGTQSPWYRAANDTTMQRSMVQSLQNSANQSGGPGVMFWAVSHEPHDNASDTVQGWHGGASDRKCGSATDPAGGTTPCLGTTSEFHQLYMFMRSMQETSCNSTGGTTGTLGFPCNKVKIVYIAVGSNMTPGATVGADDLMRPDPYDYDVLGPDVFNWGCFRKAASTCSDDAHGGNNEWKSFQTLVDDPTSMNSLVDLAQSVGKPLVISEITSHPGCNGTETTNGCNGSNTTFGRDTWFTDMHVYLKNDVRANKYIIGWSYFHDVGTYDWRFIDTTAGGDVDNRGLTEYKSTFGTSTQYRTTAAGYTLPDFSADQATYTTSTVQHQDTYSLDLASPTSPADRNHSGSNVWAPRNLDFDSGWDSTNRRNWMTFGFQWNQAEHMKEIGQNIAIEIDAKVDCDWARAYYQTMDAGSPDWFHGSEGYDPRGFKTNIPTYLGVLPYENTIVLEHCDAVNKGDGNNPVQSGRGWFGVGLLNAQQLPTGRYWITVAFDNRNNLNPRGYASPVELRVKAGVAYDVNNPVVLAKVPEFFQGCNFDTTHWNDATYVQGIYRQEAGVCQFTDWEQQVVTLEDGIYTDQRYLINNGYWTTDLLYNQGAGDGGVGDTGYSYGSGNNHVVYCNNTSIGSFDGKCAIEFNKGTAASASMYQDVSVSTYTGYSPTAEVAIRCRNGSSCNYDLAVWGRGLNADEKVSINADGQQTNIPDDGHWYNCRVDFNHQEKSLSSPHQWVANHNSLRFQVYNYSGGNMDVDFTKLTKGTTLYKQADDGEDFLFWTVHFGVGNAAVGNACTQK